MNIRITDVRKLRLALLVAVMTMAFTMALGVNLAKADKPGVSKTDYQTIEWTDLIPKEDLDALLNPPSALNTIPDGSFEDEISSDMRSDIDPAGDDLYEQALVSTRVIPAFDGKAIRLPGFIVPLEFGKDQYTITRFFLVPYFGACIHMPPPPPNQIVYAEYDKGFKLKSMYEPFWVSGVMSTSITENETAIAAYSMKVDRFEPYVE